MICFVQCDDLKSNGSRALQELEVPHLTLEGGADGGERHRVSGQAVLALRAARAGFESMKG